VLISIHQPHYLPWLRYFEKIARSDVFILLDDVQYEKNGFQNRNKIKTPQGWSYLTVPVRKPTRRPIAAIEVDDANAWAQQHARALEISYRRAPYFAQYWPALAAHYERPWTHLAALNRALLDLLLEQLQITTRVIASSDLSVQGRGTERLAELCRAVGGDTYLSGAYAVDAYLDPATLQAAGIRLAFQEWRAPVYRQLYPAAGFVPDLSIVDLLFNEGPHAREILEQSGGVSFPLQPAPECGHEVGAPALDVCQMSAP
jgi:hypothetical protein